MTIPPPSFPSPSSGQTGLVLDLRKPVGSVGMMSPTLTIDGHPAQVAWGQNFYAAPPGRRHVRVTTRYLWEYGGADADVDVFPGHTSVLHYTPPWFVFLAGRIGPSRQPRRGAAVLWVFLAVMALLAVLIAVSVAFSS